MNQQSDTSNRLISLDAFRGLTIMLMILVNNPGSWSNIYAPLKHADWHGCTPTDLVFPFFLFIVGVAIPLSLAKRKAAEESKGPLVVHIIRRSLILFALGLLLSGFGHFFKMGPDYGVAEILNSIRIPGVLQRIAVCYLVTSILFLYCRTFTLGIVVAVCLIGYWALMTYVPVPGYGPGMIDGKDTHLAAYLDRTILGTNHLWSQAKTWDPEGILSTVPAIATTLFGVFTGLWLKRSMSNFQRFFGVLVAGVLLTAIGWYCGKYFPINKPIWTSSYAVFTAGLALLVLGICVMLFDLMKLQRLALPLRVYGVNALTVFVLSGLLGRLIIEIKVGGDKSMALKTWIYQNLFQSWLSDKDASLAYAITWVLCWFVVLALMYRKNWIVKV